jgi:HJR/Mrr/RecB family endonuclease
VSFAWVILALLCVLGLLKGAASEMFQEEAKTRLEHLPSTLIRLAALALPKEMRDDTAAEWQAELASVLRDTDGLPLTRLLRGVLYAVDIFRASILIMREMSDEETGVHPLVTDSNLLDLTPFEFEQLVATLLQQIGFRDVSRTSARADGGIDITALDGVPLIGGRIAVTAKRYRPEHKVGITGVRDLMGSMSYHGITRGIIITTSGFTSAAREEAERLGIQLLDGKRFLWLLRQNAPSELTLKSPTRRKPRIRKPSLRRILFRLRSVRR